MLTTEADEVDTDKLIEKIELKRKATIEQLGKDEYYTGDDDNHGMRDESETVYQRKEKNIVKLSDFKIM